MCDECTATRITGPVQGEHDYGTTTRLAHEGVLSAPHGPAFVESIAQARRAGQREAERHELALQILEQERARKEAARDAEVRAAAFGHKGPQNRLRAIQGHRPVDQCAAANPLNGPAISFHTQHLGAIHGVTPKPLGAAATFGRSTAFSMPIEESFYDQDAR